MIGFILVKLNQFPNVFLDEANCAYDSWCLANYGVDSNLIKLPIYLQSFAGQGQSVLYAYLAAPFLKIFGYSFYIFRVPLFLCASISALGFLRVVQKYYDKYLPYIAMVLCSCPYLLIQSRYAMDCNIAIWLMLAAIGLFLDSLHGRRKKTKWIKYSISLLILGLCAYAYNVSWICLPFLVVLMGWLFYKRNVTCKVVYCFIPMIIELLPIVIFAIRSNYGPWNKTKSFGLFTSPRLQVGRASASFIHPINLHNVLSNMMEGARQLFVFGDGLSWNSIQGFAGFYIFALFPFVVGLVYLFRHYDNELIRFVYGLYVSNILIVMFVKPNYNHWMFIFIPIIFTIAFGLYTIVENRRDALMSVVILYALCFVMFARAYYKYERYTGFNIRSSITIDKINRLSKGRNIYVKTEDEYFMLAIRDFKPISPYIYQSEKDYPHSKEHLMAKNRMVNYYLIEHKSNFKKGSIVILKDSKRHLNGAKLIYKHMPIGSYSYNIFEVE